MEDELGNFGISLENFSNKEKLVLMNKIRAEIAKSQTKTKAKKYTNYGLKMFDIRNIYNKKINGEICNENC